MKKTDKILITGGHATPAFATLDELKLRGYSNFVWVSEKYNQRGTKEPSGEYKTVTEHYKIPFVEIRAGKLVRKWTRQTWLNGLVEFFNLFVGFIQAFFIILKHNPKVIISFGGFLAVPIVFWARVFRKKIITHEQTIVTGLANKIIAKFANKILVSWQESLRYFPKNKTIFTGLPIRQDIFQIHSNFTDKLDKSLPTIYITGGNQGAHEINKRIFEIIEKLLDKYNVIHQTGNSTNTNDFQNATKIKNDLSDYKKHKYIVKDYVGKEEIGEALNIADVVVSRAGANTIAELLALGKMSVLIPIPWTSHDEQTKNAKMVEDLGLAVRLIQTDNLTLDEIFHSIEKVISVKENKRDLNNVALEESIKVAKSKVVFNAAKSIVDEIERM